MWEMGPLVSGQCKFLRYVNSNRNSYKIAEAWFGQ